MIEPTDNTTGSDRTNGRPASGAVRTRAMTELEFDAWHGSAIAEYAGDVAAARGLTLEHARGIAEQAHERLLPEGRLTPGVHLVIGEDSDGVAVGMLWLGPNPDGAGPAWIYAIEVSESRRGQGWGRGLMGEAERLARADGNTEIGLNVFGSNAVARGLYDSLGFEAVSIQMRKPLAF